MSCLASNRALDVPGAPDCPTRAERLADHSKAAELDAQMMRILSAECRFDRALGRVLRRLRGREGHRTLGFVRWCDYVRERLGIERRWAQELVRLDRMCAEVPEAGAAVDSGTLAPTKALELHRVLGPRSGESERRWWIERAKALSIRELRLEVSEAKQVANDKATGGSAGSPAVAEEVEGQWIRIQTPPRVAALWQMTIEHVRRLSNERLPLYQCMEYIVADRFSAIDSSAAREQIDCAVEEAERLKAVRAIAKKRHDPNELGCRAGGRPDGLAVDAQEDGCRLATRPLDLDPLLEVVFGPALDPGSDVDPWALDALLQDIERSRKPMRRILGDLLLEFVAIEGWRCLGFHSLEEYERERLGLQSKRGQRLMRFAETLNRYPTLERAYLAGDLSYLQTILLARVVHPRTVEAWVAWAARRTFKATEKAIEYAEIYALPGGTPERLAGWERVLRGSAVGTMSAHADQPSAPPEPTSAHPNDPGDLPLAVALPPDRPGALPRIVGLDDGLQVPQPELLIACIRFWCPNDLIPFIQAGLDSCQPETILYPEWRRLEILLLGFLESTSDPELDALKARFPDLERDGWECTVPTCTMRANLHSHHLIYQGQGGPDCLWNKTCLCAVHHVGQQHGTGAIRVRGRAPNDLVWEIGRRRGGPPLLIFRGDMRLNSPSSPGDRMVLAPRMRCPGPERMLGLGGASEGSMRALSSAAS